MEDLKAFKHIEAPKESNVSVLRALFEALDLSTGLAQMATQGKEESVKELQKAVSELVNRLLTAGTDLQVRLSFWGQPLLRDDELDDLLTAWQQTLLSNLTTPSPRPTSTCSKRDSAIRYRGCSPRERCLTR